MASMKNVCFLHALIARTENSSYIQSYIEALANSTFLIGGGNFPRRYISVQIACWACWRPNQSRVGDRALELVVVPITCISAAWCCYSVQNYACTPMCELSVDSPLVALTFTYIHGG